MSDCGAGQRLSARQLRVVASGPLATIQDRGRPGHQAFGLGVSGAADHRHFELANRIVGNHEDAAAVEITLGNFAAKAEQTMLIAVTGAPCSVRVGDRGAAMNTAFYLRAGDQLSLGAPEAGLRSYLAVRGGFDVPPTLGSRSSDMMSKLGPAPLSAGDLLAIGEPSGPYPTTDAVPEAALSTHPELAALPGPRADWFTEEAVQTLFNTAWSVTSDADRVGIRLEGDVLTRKEERELTSEPAVAGALQVPPSGKPILFMADHPVTGGYPVIAVVDHADLSVAAQLRPGQQIRFIRSARGSTARLG